MQIGLGTYALAWSIGVPRHEPKHPMSVFDFLEFAHSHGFTLVQISDNLPLDQFSKKELNDMLATARRLGIEIEVGMRGLTVENVQRHIAICDLLDATLLRVVIDRGSFEPKTEEIHAILQQIIPILRNSGIKLAIENHDRLKASQFKDIVQKADSDLIGICLDSVNSIGADEGFETVFETLASFTLNLHVKDYEITRKSHMMGFDIYGTPAGEGRLPLDQVVEELERFGRCKSMILELWPPMEEELEVTIVKEQAWVEKSGQYLFENFK